MISQVSVITGLTDSVLTRKEGVAILFQVAQ